MIKIPGRRRRARTSPVERREVLFFTCATGIHQNFVIPYIYFAEVHNPHSLYEVFVEGADEFRARHGSALSWLEENLDVLPVIRDVSELPRRPRHDAAIRFVAEPVQVAKYVYIGDVDVMLLENALEHHQPVFDAGLPYSNVVRRDAKRLTGLHFAEYAQQYPLGDIDDLVESVHLDEELLYRIVERKGLLFDSGRMSAILGERLVRPTHGVHMSLQRYPFWDWTSRPDWEFTYAYAQRAAEVLATERSQSFLGALEPGPRLALANLFYVSAGIVAGGEQTFEKFAKQSTGHVFGGGFSGNAP